jgi:hypothetical protein
MRIGFMRYQCIAAGFKDGSPASVEHPDLSFVCIEAQHGIADIGEAVA